MNEKRQAALERISSSIKAHGYHVRVVKGGAVPRFAYTIGLHERCGFEIVFAGGAYYTINEIGKIFADAIRFIDDGGREGRFISKTQSEEEFFLRSVDQSWVKNMLLGALDYYRLNTVNAVQIVPGDAHMTIDVPDMAMPYYHDVNSIWKFLEDATDLPCDPHATVTTNLDVLLGYCATEVARWGENEWEIFSGEGIDVSKEEMRIVPLAMLIVFDETLEIATKLTVGTGVWRDDVGDEWHSWNKE